MACEFWVFDACKKLRNTQAWESTQMLHCHRCSYAYVENGSYKSQTSQKNVQVWIGSQVKGNFSVIVTFPDQDYRAQTSYV